MEWFWLIPLVAIAVLILSSLGRSFEAKPPPRPREGKVRTSAEVDRFLEELNRRRQQPPPLPPRRISLPEVEPLKARKEKRPLPPPLPQPPPVVVRTEPPPAPPPGSVPDLVPVAREPHRRRPGPVAPPPARTAANPAAPVVVAGLAGTPSLRDLLRDPQLVRSAMVLHEILGPPLSRRRREPRGH